MNLTKKSVNSLPNDKMLHWSKLKAFADDKIKVLRMMIFVFDRIENIVGKGENAGHQCFLKGVLLWVIKSWDCVAMS